MRPVAEITWAGAVSVQVSVPAARFGTPATFRPSSSVHAICEPSGENVAELALPAAGRSQAATRSLGTVPECWATVMPVVPSSLIQSIATWSLAGETSARLRK